MQFTAEKPPQQSEKDVIITLLCSVILMKWKSEMCLLLYVIKLYLHVFLESERQCRNEANMMKHSSRLLLFHSVSKSVIILFVLAHYSKLKSLQSVANSTKVSEKEIFTKITSVYRETTTKTKKQYQSSLWAIKNFHSFFSYLVVNTNSHSFQKKLRAPTVNVVLISYSHRNCSSSSL